jgi:hypothetical protein
MNTVSNANVLNDYDGYYTDVTGKWLTNGVPSPRARCGRRASATD